MGKRLGFPTANVQIDSGILPANGVYIVQVLLKNRKLWGISNIGLRPSVMSDQSSVLLEVHLLDFSEKIYREKLNIEKEFVMKRSFLPCRVLWHRSAKMKNQPADI